MQGSTELKQLNLVFCLFELIYALMMGKDDIIDNGLAYCQFLRPSADWLELHVHVDLEEKKAMQIDCKVAVDNV